VLLKVNPSSQTAEEEERGGICYQKRTGRLISGTCNTQEEEEGEEEEEEEESYLIKVLKRQAEVEQANTLRSKSGARCKHTHCSVSPAAAVRRGYCCACKRCRAERKARAIPSVNTPCTRSRVSNRE